MLLQKLIDYSNRIKNMAPLGYARKPVRYLIELDGSGQLRNPHPIDLSSQENKRGKIHIVPDAVRSSGIAPLLLTGNGEYTLGIARENSKLERIAQCHVAYIQLLRECIDQTGSQSISAVINFLSRDPIGELVLPEDFDANENIIFRVDSVLPTDHSDIQAFWAARNAPQGNVMQCLICGHQRTVLKKLPKIKGVRGGQAAGLSLISANKDAFGSFGLKQSQTSPVCIDCADRFTKALNHLLRDRSTRMVLNNLTFTFWTRRPVEYNFFEAMDSPSAESVRELLKSVHTGNIQPGIDDIEFYALSLSASGARAVVRDWIDTTVGTVKKSLAQWFSRQQIVDAWGASATPLGVYRLAGATIREMKDLQVQTAQSLIRSAISGSPIPLSLLPQVLRRIAADTA